MQLACQTTNEAETGCTIGCLYNLGLGRRLKRKVSVVTDQEKMTFKYSI